MNASAPPRHLIGVLSIALLSACGPELQAQCGTTVYDSGGTGGAYANNQNLTWTYCAPAGQVVTLNFTAFSTEAGYDQLSIHNGNTNAAPTLGIFDGAALPPSISGTVPGGCVTLWFTSDGSITYPGWAINIACGPPVPPPPVCGSTVYDAGGPGGNYANNSNTLTTYCPTTPGDVVTIDFTQFNTENNYDVVTVYNGPNGGSPSLGSFSGLGNPGSFTSTDPSGCITLGFIADGSIVYSGWAANITCAPPVPPPAGDCVYALTLLDSFGDGWGTSSVGVSINGSPNTFYTVGATTNNILLGVNIGDVIILTYNASGPFQFENSFTLGLNGGGGNYFNSGPAPPAGINFTQTVNCQPPPAAPQDCAGGQTICSGQSFNNNSSNTGSVVDLTTANQGCLSAGERQGTWYYFSPSAAGNIGFTISPTVVTDYDFALWGPMGSVNCPPSGPPLRCSFAAPTGNTGLGNGATDLTEGAGGDRWVSTINVLVGQIYILYVDNFSSNGQSFDLTWQLTNGASLDCTVLSVGEVFLQATPQGLNVDLLWTTTFERESDHFVIERSQDGANFDPVGTQQGSGNTSSLTEYRFTDRSAKNGVNYYRIRSIGANGSDQFSPVVSVVMTGGMDLVVVPNPVSDRATLFLNTSKPGNLSLRVLDSSGRLIRNTRFVAQTGDQQVDLPIGDLEPGSYIMLLLDESDELLGRTPFVRQ